VNGYAYAPQPNVLERALMSFAVLAAPLAPFHAVYVDGMGKRSAADLGCDGSVRAASDVASGHTDGFLASGLAYTPRVSALPFSPHDDMFAECPRTIALCPDGCCLGAPVAMGGLAVMTRGAPFSGSDLPLARLLLAALAREIAVSVERNRHAAQLDFAQKIFRSMDSGFLVLDADLTIISANPAACDLLCVPEERLVGSHASEVVLSKLIVQEARDGGKVIRDREAFIKLKHKMLHILKTSVPVFGEDGSVIAVLDHFREIKEARQLVSRMSGTRAMFTFEDIVHECEEMRDVVSMGRMAASNALSVLISGESGTGKELFAHAIHLASERNNAPFVVIDCASMPRELVPSELFGYVEGAFTGSRRGGMPGKFELANGGTVFLDELGELPLEVQAQFLRVLQSRHVTRIGGKEALPIDIRVISATNRDLSQEIRQGNFREDLFYRLNVLSLHIPSLRSRPEDIEPLARLFVKKYGAWFNRVLKLSPEALHALRDHTWPGNVRELENVIARAVHLHGSTPGNGDVIREIPMPRAEALLQPPKPKQAKAGPCFTFMPGDEGRGEGEVACFRDVERLAIQKALTASEGNISQAAKMLGMARSTIYKKMATWG